MTIRRKDGSIYRVRGPNKLMLTQDIWIDDVVVHNLDKLSQTGDQVEQPFVRPPEPAPVKVEPPADKAVDFKDIMEAINALKQKVEDKKPEPVAPIEKPPEKASEPPKEKVVGCKYRKLERQMIYCLPSKTSKYTDDVYGDEIVRKGYDNPFRFQAAITDSTDLRATFWSTIDKVTPNSILFQSDRYRWWRVSEVLQEPSGDGFLFECVPSNIKPDFTST